MNAKEKQNGSARPETETERVMSRFDQVREAVNSLKVLSSGLGQNYPQHCPHPRAEPDDGPTSDPLPDPLGRPMTIREVAGCLGCSVWTVRQQYLPAGLPHFRLSRTGKLLFFHNQIVRWVLERQRQKGGIR